MARNHPVRNPLQILLAILLLTGVATSSLSAAPGPIKGDAVATTTPDDAETSDEPGDRWQPSGERRTDSRLEYQGSLTGRAPDEATSSLRPAIAGRTSAETTISEGVETPVPVPVVDPPPTTPPPSPPAERLAFDERPYIIVSSGRPRNSTDSLLAYDGDPSTSWSAGDVTPMAYAWFDLGEVRKVAGIRWYQTAVDGPVAVQISDDRESWTTVVISERPEANAWQRASIGQEARFVRIVVSTEQRAADLAEVEIFGPPGAGPTGSEVAATRGEPVQNRPPRVRITGGGEQGRQAAEEAVVTTPEPDSEAVEITVNGETTRCTGGESCRVEARPPEVVEDCGDGTTTCTIRVSVSGGLAVCNSAGENRRENAGNGGTCAAESSGGTVDIGEVNR